MPFKLLDAVTSVGSSRSIKLSHGIKNHTVEVTFKSLAAIKISALTVSLQGSLTNDGAVIGAISNPTIAIGSNPIKFANSAFDFRIANVNYHQAAESTGTAFTLAHVVSANKYGCINIYVNAAGTISTKVPLATQAYNTAALAHTAADSIADNNTLCYIGRILIAAKNATWTANTDDMTDGSDLTTATFLSVMSDFVDLSAHTFTADELTAQKAYFTITDTTTKYARAYISTLTGTGTVTVRYIPVEKDSRYR